MNCGNVRVVSLQDQEILMEDQSLKAIQHKKSFLTLIQFETYLKDYIGS